MKLESKNDKKKINNKQTPIRFSIYSLLREGNNKYTIAKKLKIPTSLVCYHAKRLEKMHLLNGDKEIDFKAISELMIPVFESIFGNYDYDQADFLLQYLFHYMMNEYS